MAQNAFFTPTLVPDKGGCEFRPLFATTVAGSCFVEAGSCVLQSAAQPPPAPPTPDELLQQARRRAEEIVAEAQARARVQAQEQVSAALERGERGQTEAFAEAARGLLAQLHEQWEAHLRYLEREAAGLVVEIARRVLHERFVADEAAIVPVVREALRPLAEDQRVRVIVAPVHQEALQDAYAELAQVLKESAHLEIVISDCAEPGGCVAHGESGSTDARLDNRLRILEETVQETVISATAA
ncbi:MAG: FliH/SctL family protein [Armatimonadota bacterium]